MIRRALFVLAATACLATAPLGAQSAPQVPAPAQTGAPAAAAAEVGPRRTPDFRTYQAAPPPSTDRSAAAAAADRTVITISTLGLVLLAVLLIILLA